MASPAQQQQFVDPATQQQYQEQTNHSYSFPSSLSSTVQIQQEQLAQQAAKYDALLQQMEQLQTLTKSLVSAHDAEKSATSTKDSILGGRPVHAKTTRVGTDGEQQDGENVIPVSLCTPPRPQQPALFDGRLSVEGTVQSKRTAAFTTAQPSTTQDIKHHFFEVRIVQH